LTSKQLERVEAMRIAEDWCWQLLRRWGIVFRDLLAREDGAPPWFELLQVLRRLEARGEIRGGRFIIGVAGEQFALPDSLQQLRLLRDEPASQDLLVISAADPLNLIGIVTRHDRVPRTASNRVAYLGGVPAASLQGGVIQHYISLTSEISTTIEQQFHRSDVPLDRQDGSQAVQEESKNTTIAVAE
jgi:ATP-dependent Lhr-like helicase